MPSYFTIATPFALLVYSDVYTARRYQNKPTNAPTYSATLLMSTKDVEAFMDKVADKVTALDPSVKRIAVKKAVKARFKPQQDDDLKDTGFYYLTVRQKQFVPNNSLKKQQQLDETYDEANPPMIEKSISVFGEDGLLATAPINFGKGSIVSVSVEGNFDGEKVGLYFQAIRIKKAVEYVRRERQEPTIQSLGFEDGFDSEDYSEYADVTGF